MFSLTEILDEKCQQQKKSNKNIKKQNTKQLQNHNKITKALKTENIENKKY